MASIRVKFRPSAVADHEGTIYYQIVHARRTRHLASKHRILASEWDEKHSMLITGGQSPRSSLIIEMRDRIRRDIERLTRIVRSFDSNGLGYTADDVINEFTRYSHEYSLVKYMESIIIKLRDNGKTRTSETYSAALSSFRKFLANHSTGLYTDVDIMLDWLSAETMEAYEAWQKNRGIRANTISFYTRILRAVYNRAVDEGIIENRNPFRHVYTGVDKTVKRALPLKAVKAIKDLELPASSPLDFARDMFLLSFYLRGMSFVDMAFLRKTNLHDGYVTYRRRKTGQQLIIKWTHEMQTTLDKYPENTSDYLLPIIRRHDNNERRVYNKTGYNINRNLKKIADIIGIRIPLTLYVARHSWASAAKAKGIPLSVISEGMGHDSETTTQIYLASLDTSVVDRANSLIIHSLE